jgi:hypothetical protein
VLLKQGEREVKLVEREKISGSSWDSNPGPSEGSNPGRILRFPLASLQKLSRLLLSFVGSLGGGYLDATILRVHTCTSWGGDEQLTSISDIQAISR